MREVHDKTGRLPALIGAAFLMAISAVGPGFLTQTTVFTESLGASFGFVILISVLIDIGVQLNIWRVIAVSGLRAQDIANFLLPGLGIFLSGLIVLGGLAFNIGNVAGAGLGLEALLGLDVRTGAAISAFLAVAIFMNRKAGKVIDRFAQIMGLLMIIVILYVVLKSNPPVGEAALRSVAPKKIDLVAILTLIGGTVGGYISFAGAHRLIDAKVQGIGVLKAVSNSAVMGISVASLVRILLFLASLGVISQGFTIDQSNPPASVFRLAAGETGFRIFGLVMFAAGITSIIGSAYTSVSFIKSFHAGIQKNENLIIILFIIVSTVVFIGVGKPVDLLIIAGAINGIILPVALSVMLVAAYKKELVGSYRQPGYLTAAGILIVLLMTFMSVKVILDLLLH